MTADGGLYLPTALVEELAEERAARALQRLDFPLQFQSPGSRGTGLGSQPQKAALLREVRGWPAIAARPVADRLQSLELYVADERRDQQGEVTEVELPNHPLSMLLRDPGPVFDMPRMLFLVAWHLQQAGDAYWQIVTDGIGVPRELWPLPTQHVSPVFGGPDVILGYEVRAQASVTTLRPEEVVRFWIPDPETLYSGIGRLGPQANEYDTEQFRVEHLRAHFEKDATPRTAIKGETGAQAPDPPEKKAFGESWRQANHRRLGADLGLPAWIPPGWDIHEFREDSKSTLVPLGASGRDQLLAAYGVPASTVGVEVTVNRAAAEVADLTLDKNTVLPMTIIAASSLTRQLARRHFDPRLVVQFREFVEPDKDFELRREAQDLAGGVRVINGVRRDRGLDEVPWGDLPRGTFADQAYTGTVTDADNFTGGMESAEDLEGPRSFGVAGRDGARSFARHEKDVPPTPSRSVSTREAIDTYMRAAEREFVPTFARAVSGVFGEQRKVAIANLRETEPRARVRATDLFDSAGFAAIWERMTQRLRTRIFARAGKEALGLVGSELGFSVDEQTVQFLAQQGARMVGDVDKTTQRFLARELAAGAQAGESVDQLAKRVDRVFRNPRRARTIARTEVGIANQTGQLEGFRQSGIVERKRWRTSRINTRDSHAATDGQTVELGQRFELGSGATAEHPLDPSLPASDIVNCRCFVVPVFEGE